MATISIPSDVMPLILSYWDMKDRAKMAQVNRAWNQLIYRNCIWNTKRWIPAFSSMNTFLHLPFNARHVGSPYKACFFHWLDSQHITYTNPVYIYFKHWKSKGSPCLYVQHHVFEDTVIAAKQYKSLSLSDQQYIFHRYIRSDSTHRINEYTAYLRDILNEFQYIRMNLRRISTTHIPTPTSSSTNIINYMLNESLTIVHESETEIIKYLKFYEQRLKNSIRAISQRGLSLWEINESIFIKDPMRVWDSVAFQILCIE